jgi:hypothetical protein
LRDLQRHMRLHGCEIRRDAGKHTIWWNPATKSAAPVPRHTEIKEFTAKAICRGLDIPDPG